MSTPTNVNGAQESDTILPKNIGHLTFDPVEIECPACQQKCMTRVDYQIVTCMQKFLAVINCCLCSLCCPLIMKGSHDVNHYCSKCGCYIGREIKLSWYKRQLFKLQNREVEDENKWHHIQKIQKEELDKSKRKHITNGEKTQQSEEK